MGLDIHMYAEVWDPKAGRWRYQKKKFTTKLASGSTYRSDSPYDLRSTDLFAILSGTGGDAAIRPISYLRGIPDDASPEYRRHVADSAWIGHSYSWLTVAELLAFDWDRTYVKEALVDADEYRRIGGEGVPSSWCRGAWGGSVLVARDPIDRANVLAGTGDFSHVEYRWEARYRDCAWTFLNEALPQLRELGPPDRVRILFYYDN